MSTPSRRRNHSLASCEPCRKSKTRCDHRKPICASCQRRGLQCWYHPAPMTKQRNSQRPTISTPPGSNRVVQNEVSSSANSPSTGTPMFHIWPFLSADPNDSASRVLITGGHNYNIKAHDEHLTTIEDIVSQLKLLPVIKKESTIALVPKPLVLQLITSIRIGLADSGYIMEETPHQISVNHGSQLADDILRSSSSEVVTTPDLDLGAFCALFTGANLRIETLGLLYTMAARSSLYTEGHGHDRYQDDGFTR
ncbi:hypothetical protein N7471_004777 [Penicillium samsonianum]|uniref:uncharacterized protein n=1 Tax=Penicillium samsonianum TaxID=1882272 RepID=UPI002548EE72|nr:uncharacterized protein N7471_004777 [Penicillium samsonianum]KAJ6138291.1 hypothetical protein N7471_004777 [Penicillium samsonianum]